MTTTADQTKAALTWRERTLVAILLLVARMLSDEQWVHHEIKTLATNISVHGGRE